MEALSMKQKLKEEGTILSDKEVLETILQSKNYKPEHLISSTTLCKTMEDDTYEVKVDTPKQSKMNKSVKHLLPSLESICERPLKK